jgi:hypothetical protein
MIPCPDPSMINQLPTVERAYMAEVTRRKFALTLTLRNTAEILTTGMARKNKFVHNRAFIQLKDSSVLFCIAS